MPLATTNGGAHTPPSNSWRNSLFDVYVWCKVLSITLNIMYMVSGFIVFHHFLDYLTVICIRCWWYHYCFRYNRLELLKTYTTLHRVLVREWLHILKRMTILLNLITKYLQLFIKKWQKNMQYLFNLDSKFWWVV
jgi:hypothetical protein